MLQDAVRDCLSVAELLRKFGLREAGGSHTYLSRRLKEFQVDTSHFTGKFHNLGTRSPKRKHWSEFLILRTNGRRQKAVVLRRALIESGRLYVCECGQGPEWRGKELRFQVDHRNGNWLDDRSENLRFLCPNCHTQTPGYNGSKGYADLTNYNRYEREKRLQLNPLINPKWRTADKIKERKTVRPSKEILENETKNNSFVSLSKKYGVSDNAIRKWCKRYGIEWRKRNMIMAP